LAVALVAHSAIHRLQNHDGVVHQHAHCEHQAHHGEDVEGRAHEVHHPAGGDDGKRDRHGHDHRGVRSPQKEVQAQGGEQGAGEAGLLEAVDARGDLVALILPHPQLDALEQRVVVDVLSHHPGDFAHHLHRVGGGFLVDVESHGILAVQVAAEIERRLLVGNLGHLAEAQATLVDHKVGEGLDGFEGAQGTNGVAQSSGLGAAEHEIGGDALEKLRQATDVDRVLLDLVEDQVHEELTWLYPVEVHAGHPVHPSQRVEDARLEQLVVLRQVHALGGDAPLHHRNVVGVEGEDEDRADVRRKGRLHLIHLLGDLHADEVDLLAPGKFHEEVGAVGSCGGVELLDTRKGGQDLLHGFGDLLLDLTRVGVGVRDLHEHEGRIDLGQEGQGQAEEGDAAHQEHAHQDHGCSDRPAHGEGG